MKKILYFSLLFIVRLTIQQNPQYGQCSYDKTDPSKVICANQTSGNALPDDISLNITKLEINSKSAGKPWLLSKPDTFTRFSDLKELHIIGEFLFSPELNAAVEKLLPEFFNIKPLLNLSISDFHDWSKTGGGLKKWTAPPFLEHLVFENCPPERFDWKDVHTLEYVRVEDSDFPWLLETLNPSAASLKELRTKGFATYFMIPHVAFLCHLTDFYFDDALLKNDAHYCECLRYKNWQAYLSKETNATLTYHINSGGQLTCSSRQISCSKYTLEEAKLNRTKCLGLPRPPKYGQSWFWIWVKNQPFYVFIIVGVIFLGIFFAIALAVAIYMKSPDPAPVDYNTGEEYLAADENIESEEIA